MCEVHTYSFSVEPVLEYNQIQTTLWYQQQLCPYKDIIEGKAGNLPKFQKTFWETALPTPTQGIFQKSAARMCGKNKKGHTDLKFLDCQNLKKNLDGYYMQVPHTI